MRPLYNLVCQLKTCGKPFQSKNPFAIGCTKVHALKHNAQTLKHPGGGKKKPVVGKRYAKAGYAGTGPVEVTSISPRRFFQ